MNGQLVINHLAQPPTFHLHLYDEDRKVGWVSSHALGFRGFANEDEAMHAAYFAYRIISRRFARRAGRRPIPIGTEPLRLHGDDTVDAAGRPIGSLVRPGPDSWSGTDSFGFELPFPVVVDETTGRSKCSDVYRALRRSGIRWAMWRTERPARRRTSAPAPVREPVASKPVAPGVTLWPGGVAISSMVLLVAALVAPESIASPLMALGLAGLVSLRLSFGPRRTVAWG